MIPCVFSVITLFDKTINMYGTKKEVKDKRRTYTRLKNLVFKHARYVKNCGAILRTRSAHAK